jgi:hypothetical protein
MDCWFDFVSLLNLTALSIFYFITYFLSSPSYLSSSSLLFPSSSPSPCFLSSLVFSFFPIISSPSYLSSPRLLLSYPLLSSPPFLSSLLHVPKVTKSRAPLTLQRSLTFEVDYPEAEGDVQPRHRYVTLSLIMTLICRFCF